MKKYDLNNLISPGEMLIVSEWLEWAKTQTGMDLNKSNSSCAREGKDPRVVFDLLRGLVKDIRASKEEL